jgi:hypothetical protein
MPVDFTPMLSPTLVQPFAEIMQGPSWHYLLLKPNETRVSVQAFRSWLQEGMTQAQSFKLAT